MEVQAEQREGGEISWNYPPSIIIKKIKYLLYLPCKQSIASSPAAVHLYCLLLAVLLLQASVAPVL